MHTLLSTLVLFFALIFGINLPTFSQEIQDLSSDKTQAYKSLFNRKVIKPEFITFDLGYIQSQLHGKNIHGAQLQLNIAINEYYYTGLYSQISGTSNVKWPTELPVEAINPLYSYFFVGLNNGLLFFPKSTITLAIPLRLGLAGVTINERYNTFAETRGQIAQDYFFAIEPGLEAYVNLSKHFSLGTGLSYRFNSGVNRAGVNSDFNQLFWHLGIRFRIFEGDFQ
jgi:hypothetical protein